MLAFQLYSSHLANEYGLFTYTDSSLYKSSLGDRNDSHDKVRESLRESLRKLRDNVALLVEMIPAEVKGLTVHNLSHLDALWQMADILTGGSYELNPAEAYVLGCSVLLHDSGMTSSAYPGGITEILSLPEYQDALAHSDGNGEFALSETLRINHAVKAQELATQCWKSPNDGAEVFLIEDPGLRAHFGVTIGLVAHSHHWDISRLQELGIELGAHTSHPSIWAVNKVKVALLLRCIDAMHIDNRRAPVFAFASRDIKGISADHWSFQRKLSQPTISQNKLIYSSVAAFDLSEARAWDLCNETIRMIDRELRASAELHDQFGISKFLARSVAGSESPTSLSRYVQVTGWRPLSISLSVSDVSSLASTLGGHALYRDPFTPIRELIQNAADAVEARSFLDKDFQLIDGKIKLTIRDGEPEDGNLIIEIEDNGIGMTESIMSQALLDFGFSFWRSTQAREIYPGFQEFTKNLRGRYGIGFFSVFMWADRVSVCSRSYSSSLSDARVLTFDDGLNSSPILREPDANEKSTRWSTKVVFSAKRSSLFSGGSLVEWDLQGRSRKAFEHTNQFWVRKLKMICGLLPVTVEFELDRGSTEVVSKPDWRDCDALELYDFFSNVFFEEDESVRRFAKNLCALDPSVGGRCCLSPYGARLMVYDKGIFVGEHGGDGVLGFLESETKNAERNRFAPVNPFVDSDWAKEAISLALSSSSNRAEKIAVQAILARRGLMHIDPSGPLFVKNQEIVSLSQILQLAEGKQPLTLVLTQKSYEDGGFKFLAPEKFEVMTELKMDESRMYPLFNFAGKLKEGGTLEDLVSEDETLGQLMHTLQDKSGQEPVLTWWRAEAKRFSDDHCFITFN
jgi:hypothetical protein